MLELCRFRSDVARTSQSRISTGDGPYICERERSGGSFTEKAKTTQVYNISFQYGGAIILGTVNRKNEKNDNAQNLKKQRPNGEGRNGEEPAGVY
ncbi:hypothetical protein GCM10011534_45270 [Pseudooceanicola nanhaiensis]|uniref:Uncharacterized protein n=1 Tax=Pseudooceanicola nanhaiensis TaxID=375761 RepID=A0A917TCF3_9RHOB|nr:hypothetical protein GCM10011534_45270 [Pseudooceanicola nanhaiensis]